MEPTERELKLVEYIQQLIGFNSAQSYLINMIFRNGMKWYWDTIEKDKWGDKMDELMEFLGNEFQVTYTKLSDEDIRRRAEENSADNKDNTINTADNIST